MADPITAAVAAITTYVGGAFAATAAGTATLAQTITVIGVNLAASAAVSAAGAVLLQPDTGAEGSPLEWRADPTAGVPFALGRVAAAGRIVHRDEWGADNRYQSIWTVCSGAGPIQQIEGFYADDVAVSFGVNGAASTGPYANKMWLQTKLGASSDTALAQAGLDAATPGYEGWGAGQALPYRASCQLTLYQDSKFKSYPSGEPRTRLTLKGIKLYDPRLDSTVPGGSGSHRWGTPGTYAYSDNAALLALNWAMGLYEGSRLVGGIGAGSAGVHLPAFMEWANVCDANGWTASAYPSSLDDRHQVLLGLMQAGGARYARFAGKISCIVSAPKSSVVTLSVEDTAGPFEIATNADRLEKINTLVPTCRMESHNWEDVPQDEISVAAYVTADGGVIDRDLSYPYVALHADGSNRDQIAELAAYAILDSREPFSGTVPLKPWAMQIEPGDVFTISEPGFLLDGVELKCLTRSFDPMTNIVRVSFISESAGKHDFALGRTNTPPVPATLTVPDIYDVPPPAIDAWSASAGTGRQPTIVVTGSADQGNARAFIVEYRTAADPSTDAAWADDDAGWRVFGQYDIATEGVVLTGLEPETAYQVAVKYVSQFGVIGERRVLGTITTGGLTATDALHAQTSDSVGGIPASVVQGALDDANRLAEALLALALDAQEERERRADDALVQIDASLGGVLAAVNQARGRADELLSDALAQLATDVDAVTANYAAEDAAIRIELETRATLMQVTALIDDERVARQTVTSALSAEINVVRNSIPSLSGLATITYVQQTVASEALTRASAVGQLQAQIDALDPTGEGPDLSAYASITYVDAVEASLQAASATQRTQIEAGFAAELTSYASKTELTTAIADATGAIAVDIDSLQAQINALDPSGEGPDLSAYATITYVDAVEASLQAASATSTAQLQAQIDALDPSGEGPDLSAYATITYVDAVAVSLQQASATAVSGLQAQINQINNDAPDLSAYATITYVDAVEAAIGAARASALATLEAGLNGQIDAVAQDLTLVQSEIATKLATRLLGVAAGAGAAGVQIAASDINGVAASEIRHYAQLFAWGLTIDDPRFFIDAVNNAMYATNAAGDVRTFEVDFANNGRGYFRKSNGQMQFDTELGLFRNGIAPGELGGRRRAYVAAHDLVSSGVSARTPNQFNSLTLTTPGVTVLAGDEVDIDLSYRCRAVNNTFAYFFFQDQLAIEWFNGSTWQTHIVFDKANRVHRATGNVGAVPNTYGANEPLDEDAAQSLPWTANLSQTIRARVVISARGAMSNGYAVESPNDTLMRSFLQLVGVNLKIRADASGPFQTA